MHRFALLGWLWPLARQLVQLVVLVFLFGHVLNLHIRDYPLFVFSGLIVWNWFQAALLAASTSFIADRHLVFSPRLPNGVLPLVAMSVPLIDTVMALPILLVAVAADGRLHPTFLLLVPLMLVVMIFIAGLAVAIATLNVYVRDVENVVAVGLLLLFYLTPVFYASRSIPSRFQWLLTVNPMSAAINISRAVILDGRVPSSVQVGVLLVGAACSAMFGILVFRRLQGDMVDEL